MCLREVGACVAFTALTRHYPALRQAWDAYCEMSGEHIEDHTSRVDEMKISEFVNYTVGLIVGDLQAEADKLLKKPQSTVPEAPATEGPAHVMRSLFPTDLAGTMTTRPANIRSLVLEKDDEFVDRARGAPEQQLQTAPAKRTATAEVEDEPSAKKMKIEPEASPAKRWRKAGSRFRDRDRQMHAILIDWIIDLHRTLESPAAVLHLTVNIINRYLCSIPVPSTQLQLLGVAAFLIASKFEAVRAPTASWLAVQTDLAYTKPDVLAMERKVLNALGFRIAAPTQAHFLGRLQHQAALAEYFSEVALLEIRMARYPPSTLVSAAVALSQHRMQDGPGAYLEQNPVDDLTRCARDLWKLANVTEGPPAFLHAVQRKYEPLLLGNGNC